MLNFVLRFFYRVSMGCFFTCFRIKDDNFPSQSHHLTTNCVPPKTREAVVRRNRLSSLLQSEEKEDSQRKDLESHDLEPPQPCIIDIELKDEAKFLKSCGAIPETPADIRKTAEKVKGSPIDDVGDSETAKYHSWLLNMSINKLHLDTQADKPSSPSKICEEWRMVSDSPKNKLSSCISNSLNTERTATSSTEDSWLGSGTSIKVRSNQSDDIAFPVSSLISAENVQRRVKSVHFDCEADEALMSLSSSSSENFSRNQKTGNHSVPKPSPYPTPLKLTDDMQTPGTVFPATLDYTANGNNARIRSQYVYSTFNPTGAVSDGNNPGFEATSKGNPQFGRTPGDRPILGAVAVYWREDEPSHISPKISYENGIPNSTIKYKEDQKVNWHATPFEERLEKALSEESLVFQRKHIDGIPLVLEENEEADTAISQLQSLTQPKSVESF